MKKIKKKQGSLMIGILLMMLIISAISIAIIGRSKHGAQLATDSRKGYNAYQNSDSNTENFLNELKKLDNNPNKIPENTKLTDYCGGTTERTCLDSATIPNVLNPSSNYVSEVYKIKSAGESQELERNIQVDVPDRIESGLEPSGFKVELCDGTATAGIECYNKCNMKVTIGDVDNAVYANIKGYEVRRSLENSKLNDSIKGWSKISENDLAEKSTVVLKNKADSGSQYGKTYYFTVKARNKKPFGLDSLYYTSSSNITNIKVDMPSGKSCVGCATDSQYLSGLDCWPGSPPPNSETVKTENVCCNGGEYYRCKGSYLPDSTFKGCGNTRNYDCSVNATKPSNTVWNNAFYQQTTSNGGSTWIPPNDTEAEHQITPCTGKCCFKCDSTYSNWIAGSKCCSKPCGTAPYGTTCPTVLNGTNINTSTCTPKCGDPTITTVCTLSCNQGYHKEGAACVSNTKNYICSPKPPDGTAWNTVSNYPQTWSGSAWSPVDDAVTEYNATASTTSCRYRCADGFAWSATEKKCKKECADGILCLADAQWQQEHSCTCGFTGECKINTDTCKISDTRTCKPYSYNCNPVPPTSLNLSCNSSGYISLNWTNMPYVSSYPLRIDDISNNSLNCYGKIDGWYCPGTLDLITTQYQNSYSYQAARGKTYRVWIHSCTHYYCSTSVVSGTVVCP